MKLQAVRVVFDVKNAVYIDLGGFLQIVTVAKMYRDHLLEHFLSPSFLEYSTTHMKLQAFRVVFDVRRTVYVDLGGFLHFVTGTCCEDVY